MADQSNADWTAAPVVPCLTVSDAQASLDWFARLGFKTTYAMRTPDGEIIHAEVARGGARLMLGPCMERKPGSTGMGLYFNLQGESVDALYDSIKDKLDAPKPPETMFWGDRTFDVQHPDGYTFTFAEHVHDATEEEMEAAVKEMLAAAATA